VTITASTPRPRAKLRAAHGLTPSEIDRVLAEMARHAIVLEPAPAVLAGPTLLALAVRFEPAPGREGAGVRLIDNRVLRPQPPLEDPPCSEPC